MKKLFLFIILISILFVSCKENEPTAPEEETPQKEALASANIGSSGGKLTTDNFTLTIPAGAFTTSADIKLYEETENGFGENAVSPFYKITGLPSDFSLPLNIKIKYGGTLNGESTIAIGYETTALSYDMTQDTTIISYDFLSTTINDGMLIGEITASVKKNNSYSSTSAASEIETLFCIALSNGTKDENAHFQLYNFSSRSHLSLEQSLNIKNFLEQLYIKFESWGFDYSKREWPMTIKIRDREFENKYILAYSKYVANNSYLTLLIPHDFILQEFDYLKIEFNFLDAMLQTFWRDLSPTFNCPPYYWLDFATMFWNNVTTYRSFQSLPEFSRSMLEAFDGVDNLHEQSRYQLATAIEHGQAMTTLIDYIVSQDAENKIADIYNSIGNGTHQIQAIADAIGSTYWVADFHKYLILNQTFNEILDDNFWSNYATKTITLSEVTTSKTESRDYNNFSSKWYKVSLSHGIEEGSNLVITTPYYETYFPLISFFTIDGNNNIALLGSAESEIEIENVVDYNKDFLVLVTNFNGSTNSTDQNTIETKFEIKKPVNTEPFEAWVNMKLAVNLIYEKDYFNDETPNDTITIKGVPIVDYGGYCTFSADSSSAVSNDGTFSFTRDKNQIITFIYEWDDNSIGMYRSAQCSGIPVINLLTDPDDFRVSGENVCTYVDNIVEARPPDIYGEYNYLGWECDDNSMNSEFNLSIIYWYNP